MATGHEGEGAPTVAPRDRLAPVIDAIRPVLEADDRVAYAVVFGSAARGAMHARSDLDVAIGLRPGVALDLFAAGGLAGRLAQAAGRPVDVVTLEEAPPALAYRVFREGTVVLDRDRRALVERRARAILEYLDFKPIEERCAAGVLRAATRGR